ncbi:hypothetical protein M422DRAFT_167156 [Sphaerobolus stellatus SS14]|uniref:Dihydroorotate oxidase n=1 Tax=Sphaerobolus stellatus (strain SS14) TaxID=990650 RepID=A0A0C9VDG9_SPHS4|nr:hypothetical protein M422DRAFT_167156 [Sphaerobolus stellatus SS14]
MAKIHRLILNPPILNSSSFFSSSREQLKELFGSVYTGGVTVRTATIGGFPEDTLSIHKHAIAPGNASINSYGYSPIPLSQYLEWIREFLADSSTSTKPFIISIAPASTEELSETLKLIQTLRKDLKDNESDFSRIGIELNTSCPNITGHAPPAYSPEALKPLLQVLKESYAEDPTLTIGLKLAPFVHAGQFKGVVDLLGSISSEGEQGTKSNCISFLSCTNTLGSSVLFTEQTISPEAEASSVFAVPTVTGGLAGEPIHALALGNVYSFKKLLSEHPDPSLQRIVLIGIGGVSSKEAVKRMRRVGASVVECATALGIHGVGIFKELNEGL